MLPIPRDRSPDSTLALLSDGYKFIAKRCARYQSDTFRTRLMLRDVVCTMGEEAARMFYQPDRFTRNLAMPPTTLLLLGDQGSVQTLDDEAHRRRKQMFLAILSPTNLQELATTVEATWRRLVAELWARQEQVVLHDEARRLLGRAVCAWAGIDLAPEQADRRTQELGAMIDAAGSFGPRNWAAILVRTRTERWAQGVIRKLRAGQSAARPGSAVHTIAWHKDANGQLLDLKTAGIELINVLRPTVAVSNFIVFAALALHEHPELVERVRSDPEYTGLFAQEVRRFYPFFPFVGGRARQEFVWRGQKFSKGTWVLLDMYGTNHDPRIWENPEQFDPERFRTWRGNPYNFIPQGGGEYGNTHRCPGEPATVDILKTVLRLLTSAMRYDVPAQDLHYSLSHFPALPASGFVMADVRPMAAEVVSTEAAPTEASRCPVTGERQVVPQPAVQVAAHEVAADEVAAHEVAAQPAAQLAETPLP